VSRPPVPLDDVHVLPVALAASPELSCRVAASSRRSAALPPLSPPLLASPPCALHVDASRASNHALEPEIEFAGEITAQRSCRPLAAGFAPPLAACKCFWPPDRDSTHLVQPAAPLNLHASCAVGSRSDVSDSNPPYHITAPACRR
jgi:hypothetical protein